MFKKNPLNIVPSFSQSRFVNRLNNYSKDFGLIYIADSNNCLMYICQVCVVLSQDNKLRFSVLQPHRLADLVASIFYIIHWII
jgi:hypothetical protein